MKTRFLAVPVMTLMAGMAMAAIEPITKEITVQAVVPQVEFSVEPDSSWANKPVKLDYVLGEEKFKPFSGDFRAKSTVGAINAKLIAVATISSGSENIDLDVKVGNKSLGLTPVEVMVAGEANVGGDLPMTINTIKPDAGYVAGDYSGTVSILFETAAPAAR